MANGGVSSCLASKVSQYLWLLQRVSSYPYYKLLQAQGASLPLPRLLTPMEACLSAVRSLCLGSTLGSLLLCLLPLLFHPWCLPSPSPIPPRTLSTPSSTLPYIYNKTLLNLGAVGRGTLAGEG